MIKSGESVSFSGTVYTARDAAAKRMLAENAFPFDMNGAVIYFAGPTDAPEGQIIGAIGPTTSGRMERYIKRLLELGARGFIGKGGFSDATAAVIAEYGGVYLCAVGGAGALYADCVKSAEVLAYPELGCEAVRRLEVVDMPLICGIDSLGNSVFAGNSSVL
ncbi:fumarate hydratase [Clostridia bacterium]|nr:fumarate hydratase [Clostridia bacterium]